MEANHTKTKTPRRIMPMWPTYLARIIATIVFIGGPFAMRRLPLSGIDDQSWLFLYGISGCAALFLGAIVMHLGEWLVNAHLDSVETKSRFNFGLMILTAGLLAVGVATVVSQWQK